MGAVRKLRDISGKIYLRYFLLNLPGGLVLAGILFMVRLRLDLPGWFIALSLLVWVIKDVILFPFVWQSYDWERPGISGVMTGSVGIVKKQLAPRGLVQINGELWKAISVGPEEVVERGSMVRVIEREGLVLRVVVHGAESAPESELPISTKG